MHNKLFSLLTATGLVACLAGCGGEPAAPAAMPTVPQAASSPPPRQADTAPADCTAGDGIAYLCGIVNGEDILPLGNTPWVLVSGMNGDLSGSDINGKIHLVNRDTRDVEILFPGANPVFRQDQAMFADCPGPLDTGNFSAHGLALRKIDKGPEIYHLYMTSHGAREAIEVFEIDAFVKPTITWIGCVPMPDTSWTNSVAILADGGFVATRFYDPSRDGIADVMAGKLTGEVYEWHPGGEVAAIAGTQIAGANGIVVSDDERWMFVSSFGTGEVVRFDRSANPPARDVIPVGILPDNLRWTPQGTLYAAGNNTDNFCGRPPCEPGWGVVEIVPYTLVATRIVAVGEDSPLQDPSVAQRIGDDIWIGTFGGDRLAIVPAP